MRRLMCAAAVAAVVVASLTAQSGTIVLANQSVTTANGCLYPFPKVTPVEVGDLLIVGVTLSDSIADGSVSDGVLGTYTHLTSATRHNDRDSLHLFVRNTLIEKTAPISVEYTCATFANGAANFLVRIPNSAFAGLAAIRQVAIPVSNQSAGETPVLSFLLPPLSTNTVITMLSNRTNPTSVPGPFGFLQAADVGYTSPISGAQISWRETDAPQHPFWLAASPTNFGAIAIEVHR